MSEKAYELRELQSKDMFLMLKLLNKIGIKEVKTVFESDSVKDKIKNMKNGGSKEDMASVVGLSVALEIAGIVLENIPSCETEIYSMLSAISGMKPKAIQELSPAVFAEMIIEIFQKDDFRDFFKVVSKFFK